MKLKTFCFAIAATASAFGVADEYNGPWGWGDEYKLCSVVTAGGGPSNFSTEKALKLALGRSRYDSEKTKLEGQFGEGKVYRFMAINDFVMGEGLRALELHRGVYYEPTYYGRETARDWIRAGMDSSGMFSTTRQLDAILGPQIHAEIMKRVDERFGDGASTEYHMIMDQTTADLAADVGLTVRIAAIP